MTGLGSEGERILQKKVGSENKLKFIKGRMNLTKKDIKRKSEPPFD